MHVLRVQSKWSMNRNIVTVSTTIVVTTTGSDFLNAQRSLGGLVQGAEEIAGPQTALWPLMAVGRGRGQWSCRGGWGEGAVWSGS